MKKKKTTTIVFICPKCKKVPPRDEKQSNKNWNVYPVKCPECKVNITVQVSE